MPGRELRQFTGARLDAMLAELKNLVERESPSRDKASLDALADVLVARLAGLGGNVERVANPEGGDHVLARFDFGHPEGVRPALVIGHYDTVWPKGTTAHRPFRVEGDRAYGPGVYDMKASFVLAATALEAIRASRFEHPRPAVVLFTSDEEIGSPTSRGLIEAEARAAEFALILEPPLADGSLKTARKGVGGFSVEALGRSAHAGVEPEKGVNAILELAHQVVRLHGLNEPKAGTTVNVGVIAGGTTSNVVPARARARVDVRVATAAEAVRVEAAIRALSPVLPGATLEVSGHFDRPPMERSPAIAALFERARSVAEKLGLTISEGSTGGGSDGNLTAAAGLPTLDGLGAMGAGAHAEDEHVVIGSLPERAALLAALMLSL